MSLEFKVEPIEQWPGEYTKNRRKSGFRLTWGKMLDKLENELEKLGAREIVLQGAYQRADIRLDNRPRAGVRPSHPGIILSFKTRKGEYLSFPCDTFDSHEHNVYAVALSLEALRAVDRYGVTRHNEQYKGWVALPEHSLSAELAAEFLAGYSDQYSKSRILSDPEAREIAYKEACKKTHPDNGGNHEKFVRVQDAIRQLRQQPAA